MLQNFADIKVSLTAKRYLRYWFEASTNSMPARILASRMNTVVNRLLKIKAMKIIIEQGERNEYLTENVMRLS